MLDDPAIVKASENFVRIIVRRPNAYTFREKDVNIAIPGVVFLDAEGQAIGTARLDSTENLVQEMNKLAK